MFLCLDHFRSLTREGPHPRGKLRINFAPVAENEEWPPSSKELERPTVPVKPANRE